MIYLDSSVALASLLAEPKTPPSEFWAERLVSSRLLEYEIINRLHTRALGDAAVAAARHLLDGLIFFELTAAILARALEPFPISVRTLDGLHLATMDYLNVRGQPIRLATYDKRLSIAASALRIPLAVF